MGFMDAVRSCMSKYITIEGRAPRSEFWWFFLFQILVMVVPAGILAAIGLHTMGIAVYYIAALALLAPAICAGIRRLHDRDMSGWWILLGLVPLIGLALLVIFVLKGTDGENRFGPNPLG